LRRLDGQACPALFTREASAACEFTSRGKPMDRALKERRHGKDRPSHSFPANHCAHALAIARSDRQPGAEEPRIWFTFVRSLAEALSGDSHALLHVIRERKRKPA